MKPISYLLLAVLFFACNDKRPETFSVDGKIKGASARMVYLEENKSGERPTVVDSARLGADGSFALEGKSPEEALFSLRTDQSLYPIAVFINDSKKITVDADPSNFTAPFTVTGSDASRQIVDFDRSLDKQFQDLMGNIRLMDSLSKTVSKDTLVQRANDSIVNARFADYEKGSAGVKAYALQFIEDSKSPMQVLYALGSYQTRASQFTQYGIKPFNTVETAEIINKAAAKFPNNTALADQKKKLKPSTAPDFTQPDPDGKPVSLSSFRGKYVLVDFWASWCGPCRRDNPNVVAAYNQFKDKNFTILGVSLDQNKGAWLKAIQADGLAWTQVSDLQYWSNAAAVQYGVSSIPYNVLVDPSGNIIGENLHGSELTAMLGKVLK